MTFVTAVGAAPAPCAASAIPPSAPTSRVASWSTIKSGKNIIILTHYAVKRLITSRAEAGKPNRGKVSGKVSHKLLTAGRTRDG